MSAGPAGREGGFGPGAPSALVRAQERGRRVTGHCSPSGSLCRRAKLLLKKKRYREQLLDRTESQISSLEAMVGWAGRRCQGTPWGPARPFPFWSSARGWGGSQACRWRL